MTEAGKTEMTKPIQTEQEYDAALKEIEMLFGAPKESKEYERLNKLVNLVEQYEEKMYSMEEPDEESQLRFRNDQEGA